MVTILEIRQANNDNIRIKTLPSSILKTEDADMRDVVANELRDRGIITSSSTAGLAAISKDNTRIALVHTVGLFIAVLTGDPPDNENTFASADAGWLWRKVVSAYPGRDKFVITGDHEYELTDGYMIDKILMNPTVADTVRVGTTNGGDEVMLEELLTIGQWKSITMDIFATGADLSIFFTGVTDTMTIIIYKRKL